MFLLLLLFFVAASSWRVDDGCSECRAAARATLLDGMTRDRETNGPSRPLPPSPCPPCFAQTRRPGAHNGAHNGVVALMHGSKEMLLFS